MSRAGASARFLLGSLLDLFAPSVCPLCGGSLAGEGEPLCRGCGGRVRRLEAPCCPICALPFEGAGPSHPCSLCVKRPPPFAEARAFGVFEGALREAVHHFKYRENMTLRGTLEGFFLEACIAGWPEGGFDAVVPVPCHPQVLKARGFDLPALLARKVALHWGVPWRPFALRKLSAGARMAGLGLRERRKAAVGLYASGERVGGRVLLVDDVVTSTVTVRAAGRCLRRGGASSVSVAALARTGLIPMRTL